MQQLTTLDQANRHQLPTIWMASQVVPAEEDRQWIQELQEPRLHRLLGQRRCDVTPFIGPGAMRVGGYAAVS
jgi:hypothetical protein